MTRTGTSFRYTQAEFFSKFGTQKMRIKDIKQYSLPELPDPGKYQLDKNVHNITRYSTIAADMQHRGRSPRLYVHLDMNAFYAQVEQLCYNLYGMPVVVGGWRKNDGTVKGIVATSSNEARKRGIKTGMSALDKLYNSETSFTHTFLWQTKTSVALIHSFLMKLKTSLFMN